MLCNWDDDFENDHRYYRRMCRHLASVLGPLIDDRPCPKAAVLLIKAQRLCFGELRGIKT